MGRKEWSIIIRDESTLLKEFFYLPSAKQCIQKYRYKFNDKYNPSTYC